MFKGCLTLFIAIGSCHLAAGFAYSDQVEPRPLFIEGYTGRLSYAPGEEVEFHVSTSADKYAMDILRLGGRDRCIG